MNVSHVLYEDRFDPEDILDNPFHLVFDEWFRILPVRMFLLLMEVERSNMMFNFPFFPAPIEKDLSQHKISYSIF